MEKCNICKWNYRLEKMVDRTERFCGCDLDGSDMEVYLAKDFRFN